MPEENKKDNLIDVGDADEAVTEVNLDEQQPKEAAQEEKIEVEQVEAKEEKPVEEQKEPQVRIVKETVDSTKGLEDEDEISKGIKSKMMLDPDQRHVRS